MTVVSDLTEDQIAAIITESLRAGFFERDVEGNEITDPDARSQAAHELVRQARLSYAAGNRHPAVKTLLHIAEVDFDSPREITPKGDETVSVETDLQAQPDAMLAKFHETLLSYPPSDEVAHNIAIVVAEMQRRGLPVGGDQPVSAPAPEPPAQTAAPAATNGNGSDRAALEDRLTFAIMRHHKLDPSQIPSLSDDELRWILDHGPGTEAQPAAPAPAQPAETPVQEAQPVEPTGDTIQTTRMVIEQPPAEPAPVAAEPSGISADREELEGQVTGPMLKAYGRGRVDVPKIGDNELRFMIENPEARVTLEQLEAARALDQTSAPAPEPEQPSIAEQLRARREAEAQPSGTAEQDNSVPAPDTKAEVVEPPAADAFAPPPAEELAPKEKAKPEPDLAAVVAASVPAPSPVQARSNLSEAPDNPAAEIIARENLPVPPEIDEDPPHLPFDLSKVSDDELRSYHARFHACHSRTNYIVGLYEGELRDLVKLRRGREVIVANSLPQKDGRTKITDAQREAMVAADLEVVSYREQEHAVERVLRQLTALRDGYGRDVNTCSRQWSMRKGELQGAGGLR